MPNPVGMMGVSPEEFIKQKRTLEDEKKAAGLIGGLMADMTPVIGEVKSAYEAAQAAKEGDALGTVLGAIGAIPVLGKAAKPLKSGIEAFSQKALEQAAKETGRKSRTIIAEMKIDDFLKLADKGTDPNKTKGLKDVTGEIDEVPYLTTSTENGVAKVTGHEGRHRARRLKELGYDTMPVRLRDQHIRWDSQKEGTFDFEKNWPTKLEAEDGTFVGDFPIQQGEYKVDRVLDINPVPKKTPSNKNELFTNEETADLFLDDFAIDPDLTGKKAFADMTEAEQAKEMEDYLFNLMNDL